MINNFGWWYFFTYHKKRVIPDTGQCIRRSLIPVVQKGSCRELSIFPRRMNARIWKITCISLVVQQLIKKNQSSVLLATRQVNHPDFCHKGHVMQKVFQCNKAIMAILCTLTHQMETFSALLSLCAGNSPVTCEFPEQKLWCFSLICAWINVWENNREAGDLRRHHAHYDVTVMCSTLGVIFPSLLS